MSFASLETSRAAGKPAFLYLFRYGPGSTDVYGYTNAEQSITYAGVVYAPRPIVHGAISTAGNLDKTNVEVKSPASVNLMTPGSNAYSSAVVTLTIRQGHQSGSPDFKVLWVGRVLGRSVAKGIATYGCQPASTALRRTGLRRNFQYRCPLVLYGATCKASKVAVTSTTTAVDVAGALVQLSGAWNAAAAKDKYRGGTATWTGSDGRTESRTINQVNGDQLVLSAEATGLNDGDTVSLAPGCNHKWDEDCTDIHNNVLNFGGDPWIPLKNPLGITNNFY